MTPLQQIPKCKEWHVYRIVEEMGEAYYYISRNDDHFAKVPSKEIADFIIVACSNPLPVQSELSQIDIQIANFEEIRAWGEKYGDDMIPGYVKTVLHNLQRKSRELRQQHEAQR